MKHFLTVIALALVGLGLYLTLWPVPIAPQSWKASKSAGFVGDFAPNNRLQALKFFDLGGETGPEDIDVAQDGKIYAATHSGAIIRMEPDGSKVETFTQTGGRVLGIEFGKDGMLYMADSMRGLIAAGKDGSIFELATKVVDGSSVLYADDLDVTSDGVVYFTDASTRFSPKEHGGTLAASVLDLMEHSNNSRILKYDPATGKTTIFATGFTFINGLAISENEQFLLAAETGTYSIHKIPLKGENAGKAETIISNLPGFPDNINNAQDGTFWVGLVSKRNDLVDSLSEKPFMRKVIMRLPNFLTPAPTRYGFVFRIDGNGKVLETLQDPKGGYALTTGAVTLPDGRIAISSLTEPRLGILSR